ncbi:major capsid protein [Stutzerimonas nitrititolerans]|uniref:major capsid protein n=1 Tax=Stutzerimonas nitrititolerans TaxID=2482751 RepID=UPI002896F567|nr:major capsid protein [Stutzerimonas nitrititolerans]
MNKYFIKKVGIGAAVAMSVAAGSASAALPEGVESALAAAQTDGVAVAGLVLGVIIAIAAFKYIRRAL